MRFYEGIENHSCTRRNSVEITIFDYQFPKAVQEKLQKAKDQMVLIIYNRYCHRLFKLTMEAKIMY